MASGPQQTASFILGGSRKPNKTDGAVFSDCLHRLIQSSGMVLLSAANVTVLKILWEKSIPPEFIQATEWKRQAEVKQASLIVIVSP